MAYEIKNHPLEDVDDYVQNLYIDMLCSVAAYENENIEAAHRLIAHIMYSAGIKHPLSEHIKNAMQMNSERFEEFFRQCQEHELQYIFMIDSLLLMCTNGKPNRKQSKFFIELFSIWGFDKEIFETNLKTVENILLQEEKHLLPYYPYNKNNYGICRKYTPKDYELMLKFRKNSICYILEFAGGTLYYSDDTYYSKHIRNGSTQPYRFRKLENHYKRIYLENFSIINEDNPRYYSDSTYIISFNGSVYCKCMIDTLDLKSCSICDAIDPHGGSGGDFSRNFNIDNLILTNCRYNGGAFFNNALCANSITVNNTIFNHSDMWNPHIFGCNNFKIFDCTFNELRYDIIIPYISVKRTKYNKTQYYTELYNVNHKDNLNYSIKNCTFNRCDFSGYGKENIEFLKHNGCKFINCKLPEV